ncbi:hypothetical protein VdG2_06654 [Verticillium dahliae VDG2]|nr:hypothetical protein VdG2_06654 [Verticillium dahliae VDG2]
MTPSTDLNFIARSDLAQLDDLIIDLRQQRAILRSLFKALQVLSTGVTRQTKFHRIRTTLTLIYDEPRNPRTDRWREALEKLDDVSKSLCIFSLTEKLIFEIGDAPFNALIEGIRQFAEADPDRGNVIVSAIGTYVRETISDVKNKPNRRGKNSLQR